MPTTAIVLAAGEGTRMKSAHSKVTHKLLDRPLVWWSVRAARQAGADRIVVVVGSHSQEVRDCLDGEEVVFVEQAERLGTGHAVRCVRDALGSFDGPVVVLSGDSPLLRAETIVSLIERTKSEHNACTVLTMTPPNPTGYGRIAFDEAGNVQAIIEHKDCTPEQRQSLTECNSSIYCFCGARLTVNIDKIGNHNVQHEYYLTDMVGIYVDMGEPVASVHVDDYAELLGVNSRIQLAEANKAMQLRINHALMAEGVSMLDPALVWVGPEVSIGCDTTLMPLTMLWGTTQIGKDCLIGPHTRLTDVQVGDGYILEDFVAKEINIEDELDAAQPS